MCVYPKLLQTLTRANVRTVEFIGLYNDTEAK